MPGRLDPASEPGHGADRGGGWLPWLPLPSLTLSRVFPGQAELGTESRVMKQVGAELGLQGWVRLPVGPPSGHLESIHRGWSVSQLQRGWWYLLGSLCPRCWERLGTAAVPRAVALSQLAVRVCLRAKAGRGLRSCQVSELGGEPNVLGEPLWGWCPGVTLPSSTTTYRPRATPPLSEPQSPHL